MTSESDAVLRTLRAEFPQSHFNYANSRSRANLRIEALLLLGTTNAAICHVESRSIALALKRMRMVAKAQTGLPQCAVEWDDKRAWAGYRRRKLAVLPGVALFQCRPTLAAVRNELALLVLGGNEPFT